MTGEGITRFCFSASYALAFAAEFAHLLAPRPVWRWLGIICCTAGLIAHTLFLTAQRPSLATPAGSLLALAWVVAIFSLIGTVHHRKWAWALFVLPFALGLVVASELLPVQGGLVGDYTPSERAWGFAHGIALLFAAVGLSVGCVASLMYLVQAQRLRAKVPPGRGIKLPSLERLEAMNRRAVNWSFPLLTAGLALGVILLAQRETAGSTWATAKVIGTASLWLSFLLLFYLRQATALPPRRIAGLTVAVFGLLILTLSASHPVFGGGGL